MNRELKFRAFDNVHGEERESMIYTSEEKYPYNNRDLFDWLEHHEPMPVMQFTGQYDRKGREIYEDDVLRETIEHDMGDENLYYVVKWFQPTCSFVAMSYADTVTDWEDSEEEYPTGLTPEDCKRLTVCDNEFQNPDWFTKD